MVDSHFQVQLTAVLEVLMKTAVADICALTDNWFRSLHMEIMRSKKENEELRQKLYNGQQFMPEAVSKNECTKSGEPGGETRNSAESRKMARNLTAESTAARRRHWKLGSILGVKGEIMDRSASERVEQRLDAASSDIIYGPACMEPEARCPLYDLKPEPEKAQHDLQTSVVECSTDVHGYCEDEGEEPLLTECGQKTVESERKPKGGQWHWSPMLAGIKEEEMEISIMGRAKGKLDASKDVFHTIHHTDLNRQISDLKTELESIAEHGSQNTEAKCNKGFTLDCEYETQDCLALDGDLEKEHQSLQHIQLSPTKTEGDIEEEEEKEAQRGNDGRTKKHERCDFSHVVTSGLLDHTALFNNPESTSLDCSVLVTLEENADMSTTATKVKPSNTSETTLGHSSIKKKEGPRFICKICGKSLKSKYSLTVHYTLHTGERPYACTQCGKRFVHKTNLQIHQNIHTGAKPYVCTLCPKSFSDPSTFRKHKRMHSRELQQSSHSPKCTFICNICGKSLSTKQGLTYHLKMHNGGRPFTCTWCGKSFVQKHSLKIHQNIHTGAKPYACTMCSKSFADPSNLKKHKQLHM
ncbi:uncharacterized protein LOC143474128 isoform X2 [Brachyhypopomus gauderio]|uniref:uncharacterized protein LOC143474128 isoform X2 n=1 Tax=Brachyhypopomus gauderio TaxID=698409 RepID=UPI004041C235